MMLPTVAGDPAAQRVFGLDAARALAIALVVVVHCTVQFGLDTFFMPIAGTAGYFGVELFFVLSGFLIGGLLLDIVEQGPSVGAWARFMARRWLRTLPIYLLWTLLMLRFWPPPGKAGWHTVHYLSFTQNLIRPMPSDNWFGVSWSLAVEEWFYLLFSGALLIFASFRRRGALWIACGLFIAAPLAARLAMPTGDSAYWGEHMRKVVGLRLDAIAYGVVAAALWRRMPLALTLWKGPLLALGCALLAAVGVVAQDGPAPWAQAPIFSATSAGFALCLPAAMAMQPPRHRLAAAVRWLSERSYALYIVHLSLIEIGVFHAVRLGMPRNALLPGALIASLAVAELSFRCIERPILRRRPRQFPEPLLAPASALAS